MILSRGKLYIYIPFRILPTVRAVNFGPAQWDHLMAQCIGLGWAQKIETQKESDHFGQALLVHGPIWACAFILF